MDSTALVWAEVIVWWLVCADAVGYNLVAWFARNWYEQKFGRCGRLFPATKLFGVLYLGLVSWLGVALWRSGAPLFGH